MDLVGYPGPAPGLAPGHNHVFDHSIRPAIFLLGLHITCFNDIFQVADIDVLLGQCEQELS